MRDTPTLQKIVSLPSDWHALGGFDQKTAAAIVDLCEGRRIQNSAETGAGKSTLLFSHLSQRHIVFAIDEGESLSQAMASPLLRRNVIELIDGPTQHTLPTYIFPRLQLVLIDGPHAYPYPDLEYYYLYPHLDEHALLIVDDIDIPTINNLYRFLLADQMFRALSVVGKTAFFERTAAPLFDPLTGWWAKQGYNSRRRTVDHSVSAYAAKTSHAIKVRTPAPLRSVLKRLFKSATSEQP